MHSNVSKVSCLVALTFGTGCGDAWEEAGAPEEELGVVHQAQLFQGTNPQDRVVDCGDGPNGSELAGITLSSTTMSVSMNAGDTLFVRGRVLTEFLGPEEDSDMELSGTRLACDVQSGASPVTPFPVGEQVVSQTGVNVWFDGNLTPVHSTKGIYTAAVTGTHVCWLAYQCYDLQGNPPGLLEFKAGSFIQRYDPNQYPGINWHQTVDVPVQTTDAVNTQIETWDAGTVTSADSELFVTWSPHVTNCSVGDVERGTCPAGSQARSDDTSSFRWRITVYQYNGSTTCNKNFGSWSSAVACSHNSHHCGNALYERALPIVTGAGSESNCGSSSANRKFKVYAQMRKATTADDDFLVHGPSTYTNLAAYSR